MWNFVWSETPRPGTGQSHQPMVQPLQPVVDVPRWISSPRGANEVALRPAAPSEEGNRMKLGTPKPPPALSLCLCMSKVKLCKCSFERHSEEVKCQSARKIAWCFTNSAPRCAAAHLESSAENSLGPTAPDKISQWSSTGGGNENPQVAGSSRDLRKHAKHAWPWKALCPM